MWPVPGTMLHAGSRSKADKQTWIPQNTVCSEVGTGREGAKKLPGVVQMLCTGPQLCELPQLNPQMPHYLNLPCMCATHNYTKTRASTGQTYGLITPTTLVNWQNFPFFFLFFAFCFVFETGSCVAQPAPEFPMSLGMTSQVLWLQAGITTHTS